MVIMNPLTVSLDLVPVDLKPLVPGFVKRREKDVADLMDALEKDDFPLIKDIGHRLKGMGVGYGFPKISEIGAVIESAAIAKDSDRIALGIVDLSYLTMELVAQLRRSGIE